MGTVTLRSVTAFLLCIALVACGSAPKKEAAPLPADEPEPPAEDPAPATTTTATIPTNTEPASTATYEEALSTPEPLVNDGRAQLTDAQLTAPMKGIINGCRLPTNAHVTIKTAVQNGRAIGVTVTVRIDRPKTKRPPPRSQVKADAKLSTKITGCLDKAVREQSWPPSKRRDSFTTEF